MSQPRSPERPAPDAEATESSPGTNQGDTPKKGRKKKGGKKPIPEMKLRIDMQQWLRKENGKAVKVKITDLQIDKTKERGQIRSINYDEVAKKLTGYQALPPPEPLRVRALEDIGMTRFAFDGRHFFSLLRYMICFADGALYVLNGQHGTETSTKIQELRLSEDKELEGWQEFCQLTFSSTKRLGGSGPRLQDLQQAGSQSVTWIPLSEALDNMLLYIEDQKREREPQDCERFKVAVVQTAVNSSFLAPEALEKAGHTVCIRVSHGYSARGLAHCMTLFSLAGLNIQELEGHLLPGVLLRP